MLWAMITHPVTLETPTCSCCYDLERKGRGFKFKVHNFVSVFWNFASSAGKFARSSGCFASHEERHLWVSVETCLSFGTDKGLFTV